MRKLGWVDGQNMVVERRFGESADQLRTGAADLVRLKVDVQCGGFSSLKHPDRDLHPALSVGPFLSGLEAAAARFDQLGHPARTVKIHQECKEKALFFSSEIEYDIGSDGPSARLEYLSGESDMSPGRSLDLLCTNFLTSPHRLALSADSARLAPTDPQLRGIEV